MKLRYKKRLTYFTIGIFFLLGGIEYAVILPTLWLYLEQYFHSQPYMLGMVLSAFSLSSLLCAPIFGGWSDKTGNTKLVLLVANVFSVAGSFMYTLGISDWFLVASRLVAGMGSGVGSALFGDIGRTTSVAERTSIMSLFMAVRQFGLLAGPGFNLFLRKANFSIGPITVDKYTAPGVFMAALWVIHEILVLFLFWNLPKLKIEEEKQLIKENMQYPTSEAASINSDLEDRSSSIFETTGSPVHSDIVRINNDAAINDGINAAHGEVFDENEGERPCLFQLGSAPLDLHGRQVTLMSTSSEAIVNAEKYISTSPGYLQYSEVFAQKNNDPSLSNKQNVQQPQSNTEEDLANFANVQQQPFSNNDSNNSLTGNCHSPTRRNVNNSANMTSTPVRGRTGSSSYGACNDIDRERTDHTRQSLTREEENCDSNKPTVKITRKFLYDEFIREEVIVILATVFTAFFSQLVLETICTPLTKKLLGWGELENSYLYCGAGLEILLVFIFISWLSKRVQDRYLLLTGYIVLVATLSFMTWFIPQERPGEETQDISRPPGWHQHEHICSNFSGSGEETKTLVGLLVGISMDIFALPFLAVVGTSLYSKITRPETQGFSQGIRRMSTGIATILGPLWAGGMLQHLYAMFGVCLGLCVLVMLMLLLSFKHLNIDTTKSQVHKVASYTEEDQPGEDRPLLATA